MAQVSVLVLLELELELGLGLEVEVERLESSDQSTPVDRPYSLALVRDNCHHHQTVQCHHRRHRDRCYSERFWL